MIIIIIIIIIAEIRLYSVQLCDADASNTANRLRLCPCAAQRHRSIAVFHSALRHLLLAAAAAAAAAAGRRRRSGRTTTVNLVPAVVEKARISRIIALGARGQPPATTWRQASAHMIQVTTHTLTHTRTRRGFLISRQLKIRSIAERTTKSRRSVP